ncbi:Mitochondrial-processing peptidase subunit beta [Mucor velutinosus]|uniref:Mitochondrial-processing peptidase subunit beta n=1 Tax=Mucor velutinosus TaxID=708070 RepID=A0AAN7D2Q2_9FUNG|nr:Mitochondrial-processing peptidase subunit beta [Mucor velutinosus]
MAPHPTPQIHPIPTEEVQERLKRRLQTPKAMAPAPRQRQIQVLSWVASIGLSAYVVLFADFGTEKNCYTPIREWFQEKRSRFWTLSEQEKQDLKDQGKL